MTETEGHVFVTRPIVKAQKTAGKHTHTHAHRRTHTHRTLGEDSYNYSEGNWQVALCVAYRSLLGGDTDCGCLSGSDWLNDTEQRCVFTPTKSVCVCVCAS